MFYKGLAGAALLGVGTTLYMYQRSKVSSAEEISPFLAPLYSQPLGTSRLKSSFRPSHWTHMHYAVQAYQDNGGQILPEWELIRTYHDKNGYFGVAYRNTKYKHVIIAHRGTQDMKDWLSNSDLITRHLNEQESSSWSDFAKKIVEEHGPTFTYSFTGHSLGGWLAQVSLWKYQDEFVKNSTSLFQDGFAVTLDEPGAKELLKALQPRVESSYKIDVKRLDITNYLSYPHIVNTAMGHVGSVYVLSPEVKLNLMQWYTISHTLKGHGKDVLLDTFSKETGLPKECRRVLDWPKVLWGEAFPGANSPKGVVGYLAHMLNAYVKGDIQRGEYLGFYSYDSKAVNNPPTLPAASQFQLQHGIHYRVIPFNTQVLPLRNMPTRLRTFLEDLAQEKDRVEVISKLLPIPLSLELKVLLNAYQINDREELVLECASSVTARVFRDKLLHFLSTNPNLHQVRLPVLKTEILSKQLQAISIGTVSGLLADLQQQSQKTRDLLYRLSFKQGTAQLYRILKPTWDMVEQAKAEAYMLEQQFRSLENLELGLGTIIDEKLRKQVAEKVLAEMLQLAIAKQSAAIWVMYLENNTKTEKELDSFIAVLQKSTQLTDKELLLNRAYNLKAKMEARDGKKGLSEEDYKRAIQFLPHDVITWSNYAGLLTDMGRTECDNEKKGAQYHLEAYRYYQKIYPYLNQIREEQRPVVYSGMAYGLLVLAECIEKNLIDPSKDNVLGVKELRHQAQDLLKQAIEERYTVALQEVQNALSIQPEHSTALMRKWFILDKLGEPDDALEYLGRAKNRLEITQKNGSNQGFIKEINARISEIEVKKRQKFLPGQ